jgi:hypothetical protein
MMQCLGEMATWLPLPGSIPQFCARYVDDAMGFAVGWNVSWLSPCYGSVETIEIRVSVHLLMDVVYRTGITPPSRYVLKSRPPQLSFSFGKEHETSMSPHGSRSSSSLLSALISSLSLSTEKPNSYLPVSKSSQSWVS